MERLEGKAKDISLDVFGRAIYDMSAESGDVSGKELMEYAASSAAYRVLLEKRLKDWLRKNLDVGNSSDSKMVADFAADILGKSLTAYGLSRSGMFGDKRRTLRSIVQAQAVGSAGISALTYIENQRS